MLQNRILNDEDNTIEYKLGKLKHGHTKGKEPDQEHINWQISQILGYKTSKTVNLINNTKSIGKAHR